MGPVKTAVSSTGSRLTTSMVIMPITKGTVEEASTETSIMVNTIVGSTGSRLTTSMVTMPITKGTVEDASTEANIMVNGPVSSTPIIQTTSMDMRKRLHFENEVKDDLETKGTEVITLPDGVILVKDMLDMTQSEILSSDDEFSMLCMEETTPTNWLFSPITNAS